MSDRFRENPPRGGASRKSGVNWRLALKAAGAGAWEWEIGSDRTFWSPENYELLGLRPASGEATYDEWFARVHPDDKEGAQKKVTRAVETKGDLDFEYRAVWPDGTVRWIRDVGKMMLDERGAPIGMYGIQIDITEQKLLESALRESQRMEALGRVAGALAHDFNNLLTVIRGYGEMLDHHPSLPAEQRRPIGEILRAADRAAALIRQLLAFGRRQLMRPRVIDLNRLIEQQRELICRTLGENIELVADLATDIGCIRVDPGQIEQVLLNLVVNARDAMPTDGRLTVSTSTVASGQANQLIRGALDSDSYVLLGIRDTGQGMDPDTLQRIFEPFFTTKMPNQGSGLGLASVYGIVKQSGGHIEVTSEIGRGTTFSIYLPEVGGPPEPDEVPFAGDEDVGGTETILVVEDEPAILRLLEESLSGMGYSVLAAASGEDALRLGARQGTRIDLLLTDVVLPGIKGPELAASIRQSDPDAQILFISGYGHEALSRYGTHALGFEVLQKPFSRRELAARVREALDRPRGEGRR